MGFAAITNVFGFGGLALLTGWGLLRKIRRMYNPSEVLLSHHPGIVVIPGILGWIAIAGPHGEILAGGSAGTWVRALGILGFLVLLGILERRARG